MSVSESTKAERYPIYVESRWLKTEASVCYPEAIRNLSKVIEV
jgi:hypothetical protein